MRKKFVFFLIILILGLNIDTPGIDEPGDTFKVLVEKQLLETELELSKTGNLYVLFNLQEKKIQVRTKGIGLRDWDIESLHFWGNALAIRPVNIIKKSSLFPPQRVNIKPQKKEDDQQQQVQQQTEEKKPAPPKVPEVQALELPEMPSIYTIYLEGNLRIYVRVKPGGGFFPKLNYFRLSLKWSTFQPLFTLWYTYKDKPFTAVDLVLKSKEDAQALYWTFTEGCPGIIIPPSDYFLPFPPPSATTVTSAPSPTSPPQKQKNKKKKNQPTPSQNS